MLTYDFCEVRHFVALKREGVPYLEEKRYIKQSSCDKRVPGVIHRKFYMSISEQIPYRKIANCFLFVKHGNLFYILCFLRISLALLYTIQSLLWANL